MNDQPTSQSMDASRLSYDVPSGYALRSVFLDMHPDDFREVEEAFCFDLATALKVVVDEIRVIDVRYGCAEVIVLIPDSAAEALDLITQLKGNKAFCKKYDVIRPQEYGKFAVHVRQQGDTITWLHISDIHLSTEDAINYSSQEKVKETFLDQVPNRLSEYRLCPDLIFVTGDLAYSGKADEFQRARTFIESLRLRIMTSFDDGRVPPIMHIPGNHDVDRTIVKRFHREEDDALNRLENNSTIIDYMNAKGFMDDRERILSRLDEYRKFSCDCVDLGQPAPDPWSCFATIRRHNGINVGIAGLNSAWRCSSDKDEGSLLIGVPQLDKTIQLLNEADLRIGLMHHPPASKWFVPCDQVYQRKVLSFFDFVLHGHEHDQRITVDTEGSTGTAVLSAGALYTTPKYPMSVNAVRVNLALGTATVYLWSLNLRTLRWVRDEEMFDDGSHTFRIPDRSWRRLKAAKDRIGVIASGRPNTGAVKRSSKIRPERSGTHDG